MHWFILPANAHQSLQPRAPIKQAHAAEVLFSAGSPYGIALSPSLLRHQRQPAWMTWDILKHLHLRPGCIAHTVNIIATLKVYAPGQQAPA